MIRNPIAGETGDLQSPRGLRIIRPMSPLNKLLAGITALTVMTLNIAALAESPPHWPEIIAHRGESYDAPENTLASFKRAWKLGGADSCETDLHLTSDHRLIILHDPDTFRVTGGKEHNGTKLVVVQHTADELRKLDVGKLKGDQYAGEKIPLLEEVLALIPKVPHKRHFLESKIGAEIAEPLVAALKSSGVPARQTPVISFKLDACKAVKEKMPELKVYYLAEFKADKKTGAPPRTIDQLIKTAKDAGIDGLDLSYKSFDPGWVKQVHDAGLECYVWTVDDPAIARQFMDAGIDGITTNRANWLRDQLHIPRSDSAK
jgi:glycerophosphoryl diester phosphodiesterase